MSLTKKAVVMLASATVLATSQAATIELFEFSALNSEGVSSKLMFTGGGNFSFAPAAPFNIETDFGALGVISGAFTMDSSVGPVTTVSGVGSFSVGGLSATLEWKNIGVLGSAGGLNLSSAVNLSGITYALNPGDIGYNADLDALADAGTGIASVSFTFIPPQPLEALYEGGLQTSFSGDVSIEVAEVPDAGATGVLLGIGMLGLGVARKIRK